MANGGVEADITDRVADGGVEADGWVEADVTNCVADGGVEADGWVADGWIEADVTDCVADGGVEADGWVEADVTDCVAREVEANGPDGGVGAEDGTSVLESASDTAAVSEASSILRGLNGSMHKKFSKSELVPKSEITSGWFLSSH